LLYSPGMRLLHLIPDDLARSKVLALAEARHIPAREDAHLPGWVIFEAVNEAEPVWGLLKAAGVASPASEVEPSGLRPRSSRQPRKP